MPEVIACPQCEHGLRVHDELVGKPVQCPRCVAVFSATVDRPPQLLVPREPQRHRGGLILTLGLISIIVPCFHFLGPFAWVLGGYDLDDMRHGLRDRAGEGLTKAGRVCGLVGTVFVVVEFFSCIVFTVLFNLLK